MKITTYIIRFLLAVLFSLHGVEKLFTSASPDKFAAAGMHADFVEFYELLERTGYLAFVGALQLLCALLLLFARTYVLASVMLIPLILCLIASHVFMSHNVGYVLFDTAILVINLFLLYPEWPTLKETFLKPQSKWI